MTTPLRLPGWTRHYCPRCNRVLSRATRRALVGDRLEPRIAWRCTACDETFGDEQTLQKRAPAHEVGPPTRRLDAGTLMFGPVGAPIVRLDATRPLPARPFGGRPKARIAVLPPARAGRRGPAVGGNGASAGTTAAARTQPVAQSSGVAGLLALIIPLAVVAWVILFLATVTGIV